MHTMHSLLCVYVHVAHRLPSVSLVRSCFVLLSSFVHLSRPIENVLCRFIIDRRACDNIAVLISRQCYFYVKYIACTVRYTRISRYTISMAILCEQHFHSRCAQTWIDSICWSITPASCITVKWTWLLCERRGIALSNHTNDKFVTPLIWSMTWTGIYWSIGLRFSVIKIQLDQRRYFPDSKLTHIFSECLVILLEPDSRKLEIDWLDRCYSQAERLNIALDDN